MYGLDNSVKLDFMIGRQLIQVSIGSNQVILSFDQNVQVTIEGLCELSSGQDATRQIRANAPKETSQLTQLLDAKVVATVNQGDGNVTLKFSDGQTLQIIDSNTSFESYQINAPNIESVIV